jgi:transposase-like protein
MTRKKRYSAEFKREALRRANENGVTDTLVAEELGFSTRQLRRWRGRHAPDGANWGSNLDLDWSQVGHVSGALRLYSPNIDLSIQHQHDPRVKSRAIALDSRTVQRNVSIIHAQTRAPGEPPIYAQ